MSTVADHHVTATPYLCVHDAAAAIAFYQAAFGAVETMRLADPSGKIGHAEIRLGSANLMLSDEFPSLGVLSPKTLGGSPVMITLDVAAVDSFVAEAVSAGATVTRNVADQFYGRRSGQIVDPFGHRWDIGTKIENVSNDEIAKRAAKLYGGE